MPAAIPSITSENDVRDSDVSKPSLIVRKLASGMFGFYGRYRLGRSLLDPSVPVREPRITNPTERIAHRGSLKIRPTSAG